MSFSTVQRILQDSYDQELEDIFQEISDVPIGSASIAQVHKAVLLDGSVVTIKVQREHIEELMRIDMQLLKKAISFLHLNSLFGDVIDFSAVVDEMYERAKEEMDFYIEKEHILEFASNQRELVYMRSLHVYEELSSSHILVMDFVEGYKINCVSELQEEGYDMSEIGEKFAHNYIKQAIDDGFYHADPHVDNIKIVDGKIAYLDFGMMGRLSKYNRELLEQCIQAIVLSDVDSVAHVLVLMDTKRMQLII